MSRTNLLLFLPAHSVSTIMNLNNYMGCIILVKSPFFIRFLLPNKALFKKKEY